MPSEDLFWLFLGMFDAQSDEIVEEGRTDLEPDPFLSGLESVFASEILVKGVDH